MTRIKLFLLPILFLLFTAAGHAQTWNSGTWNSTTWNGSSAAVVIPFNRFNTTQQGGGLDVLGFHATDSLGYVLSITSGTTTAVLLTARLEIKLNSSDTTDVMDVSVDSSGNESGMITDAGDGIAVHFALFFVIPANSLTVGRTYFYRITTTSIDSRTAIYSGLIRML